MYPAGMICEFGMWMELANDLVQSEVLVLTLDTATIKGKVKSLCLTKHRAMKTYWGVEVQLHTF